MRTFEDYFSDDRILHYICRCRAKVAKRRNRQQLIYNVSGNPAFLQQDRREEDDQLLKLILPPRRKWKKLDAEARTKPSGQPLNSLDKNVRILKETVRWYRRKETNAPFLEELARFCDTVRAYVMVPEPVLPAPQIIPSLKKRGGKQCRPIAAYPLAAKIAICLTNRYLSERFDKHFETCSFAFRMRDADARSGHQPTHHDAFARIVDVRCRRPKYNFWVAECDIQKFYDTVNHSVLKRAFKALVAKVNRANPEQPISEAAVRVFMAYLESYSFNKNVLPLNNPKGNYFAERRMSGCYFAWVEEELKRCGAYRSFKRAKIGVPQGGALSGLIANILLDKVDKALITRRDAHLTYVRYCDDMIIMHPRKRKCQEYMEVYETELKKLKLLPHPAKEVTVYNREFWDAKSKKPYKWGPQGFVPWVGFVGYEVNAEGDVRVRKSSLAKEMQKQYDTVQEVVRAITGEPRASHRTIEESVANRLIQMSVGRVRLHNFQTVENELCWVNGFECLTDNKYSRIQMKRLDACRNRLLWRLRKHLMGVEETESTTRSKARQIVKYRKPFSYYYHAIEKGREASGDPDGG
jgi:hypothetical protein